MIAEMNYFTKIDNTDACIHKVSNIWSQNLLLLIEGRVEGFDIYHLIFKCKNLN